MVMASDVIEKLLGSDLVDGPRRSAAEEPLRAEITAQRRRRWGKEASLAAVTLGSIGGFIVVTRAIGGKHGSPFDRAVVRAMGRARHPVSNALVRGVTFFGGVIGATLVSATAIAVTRQRPRLAWQVVAGAVGGISAELGFKRIFRRERPTLLGHLERVTSTSFPSGHSMAAASLYLSLAFVGSRSRRLRAHRGALLAGASGIAAAVGASRVYLGVHWPTDVIGGIALGTAWACVAEAVFDLTGADRLDREAALGLRSRPDASPPDAGAAGVRR